MRISDWSSDVCSSDLALDHAGRLLRPDSRMVVLADADSIAAVPASRWPALTMHSEVIVLLLGDPLERDPPRAPLPFATPMHRVELDLGVASQRQDRKSTRLNSSH